MKRLMCLALCLALCLGLRLPTASAALSVASPECELTPLRECHRVECWAETEVLNSDAKIIQWKIRTAQESVNQELNGIVRDYVESLSPRLPAPKAGESCTLTVSIRYSRTGLNWMSFLVQARLVYREQPLTVRFTTRTYDMATGERIMLTDIFPKDSEAWTILAEEFEKRVNTYYPGEDPKEKKLKSYMTQAALEQADFTLHGMSLVLHHSCNMLYTQHVQMIETPVYYPQIRPYMTQQAWRETNNEAYYQMVALTFDDGPNGWVTNNILDQLIRNGVRAGFFLVGSHIAAQPNIVLREHDEGHTVGTHNWVDEYAYNLEFEKLPELAEQVNQAHVEVIGLKPPIARAPGGYWEDMSEMYMGWPLIQWTVEAADTYGDKGPDPYSTMKTVVAGAKDGGIIRLHDVRQNTVEAVDLICDELQNRGFMLVTVEELFARDGVVLEADEPYWRCVDGETDAEVIEE